MQNTSVDLREHARHYIPASDADIDAMLKTVGKASLSELFDHIPADVKFEDGGALPEELAYDDLYTRLEQISKMNRTGTSFLGDGVADFVPSPVVGPICDIRNLTTAYTPYQPELSQGTLLAHWIYQCSMARLTGFEAVNASLYDRSTSIFEDEPHRHQLSRRRGGGFCAVSSSGADLRYS
jgi:glycine dehydrogenase